MISRRYALEWQAQSHHNCALRDWLVITGPEAGQVWHDERVDQGGLWPYESADGRRVMFTEWYLDWLDEALGRFGVDRTIQLY